MSRKCYEITSRLSFIVTNNICIFCVYLPFEAGAETRNRQSRRHLLN